jgi:hypothetical protein
MTPKFQITMKTTLDNYRNLSKIADKRSYSVDRAFKISRKIYALERG